MSRSDAEAADVIARNAAFVAEAAALGFRWRCADCTHVIASTGACSMECPSPFLAGPPRARADDGRLLFCKYFELGPG